MVQSQSGERKISKGANATSNLKQAFLVILSFRECGSHFILVHCNRCLPLYHCSNKTSCGCVPTEP